MNDVVKHVKDEFKSGFADSFKVAGAIVRTVATVVTHPKALIQQHTNEAKPQAQPTTDQK